PSSWGWGIDSNYTLVIPQRQPESSRRILPDSFNRIASLKLVRRLEYVIRGRVAVKAAASRRTPNWAKTCQAHTLGSKRKEAGRLCFLPLGTLKPNSPILPGAFRYSSPGC